MLKAKNKFLCLVVSAIIRSGFLFYLLTYRILDHNFQFSIFNFQLKYASSKFFATCIEYLPLHRVRLQRNCDLGLFIRSIANECCMV